MSYDIIVFGATGFTGRLAAQRLSTHTSIKLAIAGRNRKKLEAVAAECKQRPDIIVADADDKDSIRQMVRSGRVIANFAGPFALHGPHVVEACAELGRSYCDITGETPFIRDMIDRFEGKAMETGACLIPMAGFDSVPAELLCFMAFREGEQHGWEWDSLTHYYQISGGFNGGTLASALTMAEQRKSRQAQQSNILIPDSSWDRGPRTDFRPTYEPVLKRWSAPFLMNSVNRAVVRRSIYLGSPGKGAKASIEYSERSLTGPGLKGRLEALAMTGGLAAIAGLTEVPLGRALLRKLGPKPGEGPSEASRKGGFYRGRLIARQGEKARLMVQMDAKGDPGNEVTVLCAVETALLLLEGRAKTKGFTTVSRAFGNDLIDRLEAQGVRFTTEVLG